MVIKWGARLPLSVGNIAGLSSKRTDTNETVPFGPVPICKPSYAALFNRRLFRLCLWAQVGQPVPLLQPGPAAKKETSIPKRITLCMLLTLTFATSILAFISRIHPVRADDSTDGSSYYTGYPLPPGARGELNQINAQIDKIEYQTLQMINTEMSSIDQIQTLGKLELFDRSLSVHKNEACSTCHMPTVGYTGASQILNETTVAYPGSVLGRFSGRKPQSYNYATLAPVLHYNTTQQDFYGGNFWDMRATGSRLQSPSAEQAQGPPTNPVEMGLPDSACVAYRIVKGQYESLFVKVWGPTIESIQWPANAEKVCSTPR